MKKLLLVDGNSMLFRAYYATAYGGRMTSPAGLPTNAVFGFATMMQKAIELVQPDAMLVAFDAGKHTFRHDLYPEYKGGRKPAPDDLVPQFGMVRDYLDGYHIKWVEMTDIEADDLIGTMSRNATEYNTIILTSDHDLLQLIDDSTTVMLMKKGITEMDEMNETSLKETMGITPAQIIDMKGLMGDHSDNIPGIAGIGEKTALKLLSEYGDVEHVLENADNIKGALGKKIQSGKEMARLSKTLATIRRDVDIDITPEDCMFAPDYKDLIHFLDALGMKSLSSKYAEYLNQNTTEQAAETQSAQIVDKCPAEIFTQESAVYLDASNQFYLDAEVYGIALSTENHHVYLTIEDALQDTDLLAYLKADQPKKIGYDIKRNLHLLDNCGLRIAFGEDTMLMASLADSTLTSTEKIMERFGLSTSLKYDDVYGKPSRPKLPDPEEQKTYACENADNILKLYKETQGVIQDLGMTSLYRDIEFPLTFILCNMETEGVRCDVNVLEGISAEMQKELDRLQAAIYKEAGREFNINSPKQLAEVLYDDLGLPSGKKRSTSADVLEKLAGFNPIIDELLVYRKLQKIVSTYAEGLQKYIRKDGKIHTIYNQSATQTGRLSSSEPNLQNISVRDEQGKIIRKAFKPSEGNVLISSDYHQIELRILAHMAEEQGLIDAFRQGIDIHDKTAMDVFGVTHDGVTPELRRRAKTVNFGIVYGISDFGLAEQLGISRYEANQFIDSYYKSYPNIRSYMDKLVSDCDRDGYVTTICGRRREIPEIHDKNRMVREFGKRAAMNAPIQGSAADLIKIAMIHIDRMMKAAGVKSKMILQVHDELIFDVPQDEIEQMKELITEGMTHAMDLTVPLTVECSVGNDWYEAK
ncbi:MAG: DNA polymerase I [Solobacterium sp.]|nr:DNA polymerase I [Solobacterium sp.]